MSKERGDKPEMSKESGSVPISYKDYITKENFPSDEDIDDELTYTTLQKVVAPSDRKVKYKKPKLESTNDLDVGAEDAAQTEVNDDVYSWLNSLCLDSRIALNRAMWTAARKKSGEEPGTKDIHQVYGEVGHEQLTSYLKIEGCLYSGNEWVRWATCETIPKWQGQSGEHGRWQLSVINDQGLIPKSGAISSLKNALTKLEFEALVKLVNDFPQKAKRRQLKLHVHHVGYLINSDFEACKFPVVKKVGAGSSISHLCDQRSCARPTHIEVAEHHISNMDRQRCPGVTLLIFNNTIIQETPCAHSGQGTLQMRLQASCRKIFTRELTSSAAQFVAESLGFGVTD